MGQELLDSDLLRRLERLQLLSQRWSKGALRGERRSRNRGYSVEFADYRNYVAGDDLRYLDWNLYGRLDRLFLRLYEEDRELPVTIFLDASESMTFGEPSKFRFAKQVAAAIGHVVLCGSDRVSVRVFPEPKDHHRLSLINVRSRHSSLRLLQNLSELQGGGQSDLNEELRKGAIESPHAGMAVVLSDFLSPTGYEAGIKALMARGFQIMAVSVWSAEEFQPTSYGDLKFVDAETGAMQEVSFGKFRLRRYQAVATAYVARLAEFCRRRGVAFWSVSSATSLEDLLLKQMRQLELWR